VTRVTRSQLQHPPAAALVATGAFSVQFGAALAIRLFHRVGPEGAVMLRLVIAAVLLAAVARPRFRSIGRADLGVAVSFGLVLAGMNLCFYEAIATSGGGRRLDPAGIALAFLAGAGWIGYILLSKQTGRRFDARTGLGIAMVSGGLALLPVGLAVGGAALFHPDVLLIGAAVALLSSVVPYSLELIALRQVTPRAFGVLLSMDPAVATAAGFIVLGQHLTIRQFVALILVSAANLGNAIFGRPGMVATTP
jgi:inner membrane transporter RhtA